MLIDNFIELNYLLKKNKIFSLMKSFYFTLYAVVSKLKNKEIFF